MPRRIAWPTRKYGPGAGNASDCAGCRRTGRSPQPSPRRYGTTSPAAPAERAAIAEHASVRGSGRVGRSAAGRALDETAITLAVRASIRPGETDYDALLMSGVDRHTARARLEGRVAAVLHGWRSASEGTAEEPAR